MPYSITTRDGITINNIPDDIASDAQVLRDRVASIRSGQGQQAVSQPQPAFVGDVPTVANLDQPEVPPIIRDTFPGSSVIEPALAIASAPVATITAGLAGAADLLNPFTTASETADTVRSIQDQLTFQPKDPAAIKNLESISEVLQPVAQATETVENVSGEAGFNVGGPLLGALAKASPAAILEILGLGGIKRVSRASKAGRKEPDIRTQGIPEEQDYNQVLGNLKNKKIKQASVDARPDAQILQDAKDLNIDLNPDHYSNNRVFQEITQSLKSRPGSTLGASEAKAIEDLGARADELIVDLGGELDKSLLDANLKESFTNTITDLEKQSDVAYKSVGDAVPAAAKFDPTSVRDYLDNVLSKVDGDRTVLSDVEKKLFSVIETPGGMHAPPTARNPTYEIIDRIRKDVGRAFSKKTGPFKEDSEGILKQVYRALSEDQQGVADSFGVGEEYAAARKLVQSRKEIEDKAITLFGKEVGGSIIPQLKTAGKGLTIGDTSKFKKLMNALPEARRGEAAASMLNDIFTQGARTGSPLGGGFASAFKSLNRNKVAKDLLFKNLPNGARARFDKIGRVATGIFRSKALENTSRTARDLVAAMNDGGMFGKIYDVGKSAAAAESVTTAAGIPGIGTTSVLTSALTKGRTPKSAIADKFITSRKFKDAIEQSAKTGDPKTADKILSSSPEYKKWLKTLTGEEAAMISLQGFIPWLTGSGEQDRTQPQ